MMEMIEFLKQIAIVTILYNKKWYQSESIRSVENIARDCKYPIDLFVFDNSPGFNENEPVGQYSNCVYIPNCVNNGVSQSYNEAAVLGKAHFKKWLLITDSDFTFDTSLVAGYINALDNDPQCKLFCPVLYQQNKIISPYKKVLNRYKIIKSVNPGKCDSREFSIVNSGILCSLDVFETTGGYDPQIPLDFSDDYFMWQYSRYYSYFVVIDFRIEHKLSAFEKHSFTSAMNRFRFFCIGSRKISKKIHGGFWLYFWAFMRMCKLVVCYKKIDFLRVFLLVHILGRKMMPVMAKKNQ